MRMVIVVLLALVAVAGGGVWGLGQFGGGLDGRRSASRRRRWCASRRSWQRAAPPQTRFHGAPGHALRELHPLACARVEHPEPADNTTPAATGRRRLRPQPRQRRQRRTPTSTTTLDEQGGLKLRAAARRQQAQPRPPSAETPAPRLSKLCQQRASPHVRRRRSAGAARYSAADGRAAASTAAAADVARSAVQVAAG